MVLAVLRVVAGLVLLTGCVFHETHLRCREPAECSTGEQCYLGYCVIGDAGNLTATPDRAPQQNDRDAPSDAASESNMCELASSPLAAHEGACCVDSTSCYDGPDGTVDVGLCKAGARACFEGKLSACVDSTLPRSESCDNPGADDDCDGTVDNIAGRGEVCALTSGFGPCGEGHRDCAPGMSSLSCVRDGPQPSESCNDQDDDCDGQIDEGFDISSDRANCGTCGKACSSAELCCGGSCLATAAASASGCPACSSEHPCAATASCCGGACRDLKRDRRHCGSCGHSCEQAQRCCDGTCQTSCN